MGTAKVIQFVPRAGLARPPAVGLRRSLRGQLRARLQANVNAAANTGYWWGVWDVVPFIPVAFLAGACFAFTVMP